MIKYLPLTPFAAAFLLLGCNREGPVADNLVTPSEEMLGDASATGVAAPANAAAAERTSQAALPIAENGLAWTVRAGDGAALFGPSPTQPAFSIRCHVGSDGTRRLAFVRHVAATADVAATMSFTGNGSASSLPATGVADAAGPGGHWQAMAETRDMGRAVARTFAGPAAVNVSVGGTSSLAVLPSPEARKVMADCLGRLMQ